MQMKQVLIIILLFLLASCKKNDSSSTGTGTNTGTKIKRIITSAPGSREASVEYFEYDANNRLSKYTFTNEDSSLIPIVLDKDQTFYFYSANENKPTGDSIVINGTIFKNSFTYDAQDRLIKTEQFNSNGTIFRRNLYSYATNKVIWMNYFQTAPGSGVLFYASLDTLFLDAQSRLTEQRSYFPPGTLLDFKETFTYNASPNPCDLLNTNKYLATYFNGSDYLFLGNRYRNNMVTSRHKPNLGTAYGSDITSYSYNASGYPVSATGLAINDLANPSVTSPFTVRYEYY